MAVVQLFGARYPVLDGIGMVYRVLIFLFRSSPSLSSSVYFYYSLPIAAPGAENSRGTVPGRSTDAEGISFIPCRDRVSRALGSVPHRFPEDFPLSPSFQMSCSVNEAGHQVPVKLILPEVRVQRLLLSRYFQAHGPPPHRSLDEFFLCLRLTGAVL